MICSNIEKISARLIIVVIVSFFCSIGCEDRTANGESSPNPHGERLEYRELEGRIVNLEKDLKWVGDTQEFYLLFNNYRIGIVGLLIGGIGLVTVIINLFVFQNSARHLINMKGKRAEAEKILDDISASKKDLKAKINDVEEQLMSVIDKVIIQMSAISAKKADTVFALKKERKEKTGRDILSILIEMQEREVRVFDKLKYEINLFHLDDEKVKQSIMYFRKMGTFEDIVELQRMLERNKSAKIIHEAHLAIREIRDRDKKTKC